MSSVSEHEYNLYHMVLNLYDLVDVGQPVEPLDRNVLVKIGGQRWRCPCGCNVFTKWTEEIYECNSCEARYEAE